MSWNIVAGILMIIFFWVFTYFVDKISLSSIVSSILVVIFTIIPWFNNGIMTTIMGHDSGYNISSFHYWVTPMFALAMSFIIIFKHRSNIKRLIHGQESSFRQSVLKRKPGCKLFKKNRVLYLSGW